MRRSRARVDAVYCLRSEAAAEKERIAAFRKSAFGIGVEKLPNRAVGKFSPNKQLERLRFGVLAVISKFQIPKSVRFNFIGYI